MARDPFGVGWHPIGVRLERGARLDLERGARLDPKITSQANPSVIARTTKCGYNGAALERLPLKTEPAGSVIGDKLEYD